MAIRITYSYQQRDPCTGAAVGDPVTVTDPPCDGACDTSQGRGLYVTTRVFHTDTCASDPPVCVKAPECPLDDCQ